MKKLLTFSAVAEGATGLALVAVPALVGRLLLGAELSGVAVAVGRVAGIALVALGTACLPGAATIRPALRALLLYNLAVGLYLLYVAIRGEWVGPLLWPAAVLHVVLAIFFARGWLISPKAGDRSNQAIES